MGSGGNANIPTIRGAMRHEGGIGQRGEVGHCNERRSGEIGYKRGILDGGEGKVIVTHRGAGDFRVERLTRHDQGRIGVKGQNRLAYSSQHPLLQAYSKRAIGI